MVTTQPTPAPSATAEQIARQFQVEPLEARLEMAMPYGRDRESPTPSGASAQ